MRVRRLLATVAVTAAAGACGGTTAAGPPEVRWGVDECSHCHMIVGEERFAAVARSASGEEARFDDVGCLLAFLEDRGGEGWRPWLHDSQGPAWIDADAAWLVRTDGLATPMGSGLSTFASRGAAAAVGEPLAWGTLAHAP